MQYTRRSGAIRASSLAQANLPFGLCSQSRFHSSQHALASAQHAPMGRPGITFIPSKSGRVDAEGEQSPSSNGMRPPDTRRCVGPRHAGAPPSPYKAGAWPRRADSRQVRRARAPGGKAAVRSPSARRQPLLHGLRLADERGRPQSSTDMCTTRGVCRTAVRWRPRPPIKAGARPHKADSRPAQRARALTYAAVRGPAACGLSRLQGGRTRG
jgi:hypothetical protein